MFSEQLNYDSVRFAATPTMIQLEEMGCHWEGSNIPTLMSVDIAPEFDYTLIRRFLDEGEEKDLWSYEESCLAHNVD